MAQQVSCAAASRNSQQQVSEGAICLLHRYQVVSEAWVRKGGTVGLFKGDAVRDAEM